MEFFHILGSKGAGGEIGINCFAESEQAVGPEASSAGSGMLHRCSLLSLGGKGSSVGDRHSQAEKQQNEKAGKMLQVE